MVRFPHTATVGLVGSSTRDGNGDWVTTPAGEVELSCRLEPNSNSKFLTMADGSRLDYSAVVFIPLGQEVKAGSKITVKNNGITLIESTVKHAFKSQINQRLWL